MKTYITAIEEIRKRLRPLHEQACKARDEAQKTATDINTLLFDLDKLTLTYLEKGE